jgi:hypothetical protein
VASQGDIVTGLRNERKACHFWVDNEVVDIYQAIVGADAIWVYSRIARNAHGAWIVSPARRGDMRVSLREMADWCGKSVDTVWRCLQILEHVGLLRGDHGTKSKGRYALVDVKDLVTGEGGYYDREMGSFRLPPAKVGELQQQVRDLRLKLARKKVGLPSVAQSDRFEQPVFSVPEAECDRSVAPSDKTVALGATGNLLLQESKKTKLTTTPIAPKGGVELGVPGVCDAGTTKSSAASVEKVAIPTSTVESQEGEMADHHAASRAELGGEDVPGLLESAGSGDPLLTDEQLAHLAKHADDPEFVARWTEYYNEQNRADARAAAIAAETERVERERIERLRAELSDVPSAKRWVMRQCGFVERNRRRGISQVIEAVLWQGGEEGKTLLETAQDMAKAWKSYQKNGEYLRIHYGPVKFFELGIWKDSRGWGWDEQKLERERSARTGSY